MHDVNRTSEQAGCWRQPAEMLRLVAHPMRLMILDTLCGKPRCVKDLNRLIPVVQPHLSQHMAALRQAQLVDFYSSGTLRCYYIVRPALVRGLIALLQADHPKKERDRSWVLRESKRKIEAGRRDSVPAVNRKNGGK